LLELLGLDVAIKGSRKRKERRGRVTVAAHSSSAPIL
jgi:hypothetical protein